MLFYVTYWLLSGLIFAACLFAFWKGDEGVRMGAAVILGMIVIERIIRVMLAPPHSWNLVIGMAGDGLTACGLLFLAMRYASPWIGGVMLFYAMQFAIHAFYFVTHRPDDGFRFFALSACFVGLNICLVGGAAHAWRQRMKSAARTGGLAAA